MAGEETIKVRVNFTGLIDVKCYTSGNFISIQKGASLSDLLSKLGIKDQHKRYLIAMINDKKEELNYILNDNDTVSLFLPVGGG